MKSFLLVTPDIAIGIVVEEHGHHPDMVLHRCSEFLYSKHEPSISSDGDDRFVGIGNFHSEGSGESKSESSLIPASDIGSGLINGEAHPGGESHLGDLLHKKAVSRQDLANHFEVGHLRLQILDFS